MRLNFSSVSGDDIVSDSVAHLRYFKLTLVLALHLLVLSMFSLLALFSMLLGEAEVLVVLMILRSLLPRWFSHWRLPHWRLLLLLLDGWFVWRQRSEGRSAWLPLVNAHSLELVSEVRMASLSVLPVVSVFLLLSFLDVLLRIVVCVLRAPHETHLSVFNLTGRLHLELSFALLSV